MSNLKPTEAEYHSTSNGGIDAADVFALPTLAPATAPPEQKGEKGEADPPLPLLAPPLAANDAAPPVTATPANDDEADDVYTPAPVSNPVLAAIRQAGLYLEPLGGGRHRVTCPWATEHASDATGDAEYAGPDRLHPIGTFRCAHEHGERMDMDRVLVHLGLTSEGAARGHQQDVDAAGDHGTRAGYQSDGDGRHEHAGPGYWEQY